MNSSIDLLFRIVLLCRLSIKNSICRSYWVCTGFDKRCILTHLHPEVTTDLVWYYVQTETDTLRSQSIEATQVAIDRTPGAGPEILRNFSALVAAKRDGGARWLNVTQGALPVPAGEEFIRCQARQRPKSSPPHC